MKSFVSFRYDEIAWSNIRPAMMGIQAVKSNFSYNYPSNVFQLDGIGLNTNVPGVSIFNTSGPDPMVTQITENMATGQCMMWSFFQNMLVLPMPTVSSAIAAMPPCPCSGFQAMFTPGYAWLPNSDCFVTTTQLYSNDQGGYMGQVCVKMCSYCVLTEHGTVVYLAVLCV